MHDLEQNQSREYSNDRAGLTEIAVPQPSESDNYYTNSLEDEQELVAQQRSQITRSDGGPGASLTEITAPAPIRASRESGGLDHRRSVSPEHETVASEKRLEEVADQSRSWLYQRSTWLELFSISWVSFFAILGTLARLGIEAITTYPYSPVSSPVLWANLGGSLFFGFLSEDRQLFRYAADVPLSSTDQAAIRQQVDKRKKLLPLYIGLATGFCGSFTSFSTFITDAFLALSNDLPGSSPTSPYHTVPANNVASRHGGYSFMATVAIIILHPAVSISGLKAGAHLAAGIGPYLPSLAPRLVHKILDPLSVLLGFGCWLGAVILAIWPPDLIWRRRVIFSLVFAPPGALLRFYASKWFNARIPSFPMGTFIVNIFGTVIAAMAYDLQHARRIVGPGGVSAAGYALINTCGVLEGVTQGFCGCTTTVSTWVAELNGLRRRHAWVYGVLSVGIGLAFQVIIMGSMKWTIGFDQSCSA